MDQHSVRWDLMKNFFSTFLWFPAFWDHKLINGIQAYSSGVYTSGKILNLTRINKNHLKCDVIDGSIVHGLKQLILQIRFRQTS